MSTNLIARENRRLGCMGWMRHTALQLSPQSQWRHLVHPTMQRASCRLQPLEGYSTVVSTGLVHGRVPASRITATHSKHGMAWHSIAGAKTDNTGPLSGQDCLVRRVRDETRLENGHLARQHLWARLD